MIKAYRVLFSSLAALLILISCSLPVMASNVDVPLDEFVTPLIDPDIIITSQPFDIYADVGDSVTLHVEATGNIKSYRWYYRLNENANWNYANGDGYNTETFTFVVREGTNGYQYICQINDKNGGKLLTNIVTLTIVDSSETDPPATDPPVIVPPSVDNSFTIGDVLGLFNTGAAAVVSWFSSIMDSTGAGTVYIAMMSVVLSIAILLGPLLGSARAGLSDVVHRPRQNKEEK